MVAMVLLVLDDVLTIMLIFVAVLMMTSVEAMV